MCLYIFPNLLQGEMYLPKHNNLFHFYFDNFLQIAHNADAASCLHLQIDVSVYGQYFYPFLLHSQTTWGFVSAEFPIDFPATSCQSWNESERAKGDGGGNTFWLRVICANCTLLAQKTTFWCSLLSWWCLVRKMSMSFHKITCLFKRLPRFNLPLAYQCSLLNHTPNTEFMLL